MSANKGVLASLHIIMISPSTPYNLMVNWMKTELLQIKPNIRILKEKMKGKRTFYKAATTILLL